MNKKNVYKFISTVVPILGDICLIYFIFNAAYFIRFYSPFVVALLPPVKGIPAWSDYHHAILGVCFLWVIIFTYSGMYYHQLLSCYDEFVQVLKSVTLATMAIMAVTFLYREFEYSRLVITFVWGLSVCVIYVFHQLVKISDTYVLYKLFGPRKMLIIGNGKTTDVFKRFFDQNPKFQVYYETHFAQLELLSEFLRTKKIEEVIITSYKVKHEALFDISNICDGLNIELRLVPDILELRMGELIIDSSFGLPLLHIKPVSLYGFNRIIKRISDVVLSIVFLGIFLFPLLFVGLLIIWESPGGIFYINRRVGYKGKMFPFFKFRSMVRNADQLLENLKNLSERDGPVFKMKWDPRITFVGRVLRRLSLDELPQIINVLRNEMSIIGPRPQVIWEAAAYDEYAKKRLNVLPGITGLWQVSGRAKLGYDDMIRLDIYYIENWSLGLDLKIILKTIPTVLVGEGAY